MNNNPLLGRLLSEHKLVDYRRTGLIGCGAFLIVPFICGAWSLIASLTYGKDSPDAELGFYFSLILVVAALGLFGLLALTSRFAPAWQKRYRLEIYENGFVRKNLFNAQTCLWSEIGEVNPMLLQYGRRAAAPAQFRQTGEDTGYLGVYEIYKKDGGKITLSRRYADIKRLDERLIPFCREVPNW